MRKDWLPEISDSGWQTLLIGTGVAVVLWLVARYGSRLAARWTHHYTFLHEVLVRVAAPMQLLLPLLGLQAVWGSAPDDLDFIKSFRQVTSLAMIAAFTWLGLRAVSAIEQIIAQRFPLQAGDEFVHARRVQTQTRVLTHTLTFIVVLFGAAAMLMTIPAARQLGTSLLASAGVAGIAIGFAAKPVLGNLIAGLQIAITQPISLDDVVIVENEWGRIEEITGTYVVVRIWDDRRLVVPLQWFIENPFQNWTRNSAAITGAVMLWVDYSVPLEPLRQELKRLLDATQLWDRRVSVLQVTDTTERAIQLRILVSAADSSRNWDLRCYVRENFIAYIQKYYPHCLPQLRAVQIEGSESGPTSATRPSTQLGSIPEQQPPV